MKKFENGEAVEFFYLARWVKGFYVGSLKNGYHAVICVHTENIYKIEELLIIKPKPKMAINGFAVNAPMTKTPSFGDNYYFYGSASCSYNTGRWTCDNGVDLDRFRDGIFDNKEDAIAFFDALYKPVREYLK